METPTPSTPDPGPDPATDPVDLLARAYDQTGELLAAVRDDQLGDPTPCGDWDLATLLGHVVASPGRRVDAGDFPG